MVEQLFNYRFCFLYVGMTRKKRFRGVLFLCHLEEPLSSVIQRSPFTLSFRGAPLPCHSEEPLSLVIQRSHFPLSFRGAKRRRILCPKARPRLFTKKRIRFLVTLGMTRKKIQRGPFPCHSEEPPSPVIQRSEATKNPMPKSQTHIIYKRKE